MESVVLSVRRTLYNDEGFELLIKDILYYIFFDKLSQWSKSKLIPRPRKNGASAFGTYRYVCNIELFSRAYSLINHKRFIFNKIKIRVLLVQK